MFKLALTFVLVFFSSLLPANIHNSTISIASGMMKETLQESLDYNRSLIRALQSIRDEKGAEESVAQLRSLQQTWGEKMQRAKIFADYLKNKQLNGKQIPCYCATMSQYRLKALYQKGDLIQEVKRLNDNDWYGIESKIKKKIGYLSSIAHSFGDQGLKHHDTKDRIEEYRTKTENLADEFLNHLTRITSSETAKQLEPQLATLLKNLQEANDVINLYLYDDFDGGKQLLPGMMKRFYDLNGCLLDEVERIKKHDYYHDSALKEFILSLGFPILHLLAEPVERTDRMSLPE